jgi:hypothetical protein
MNPDIAKQTRTGIVFIAAGVLLLLLQLGLHPGDIVHKWWPLALVAFGTYRGPLTPDGFKWIGYGVIILLWTTQVLDWRESWPLVLVLHGAALTIWSSGHRTCREDGPHVR